MTTNRFIGFHPVQCNFLVKPVRQNLVMHTLHAAQYVQDDRLLKFRVNRSKGVFTPTNSQDHHRWSQLLPSCPGGEETGTTVFGLGWNRTSTLLFPCPAL